MYGCNLRNMLDQFASKNVPNDNYWPACVNSLVTNEVFKKNSLYQQKQNSFGYSAQEKGHISIYWLREMSWIGYSLSEQSFLFIESFKSIPGQLQAFGIENNLNSINLHLLVLIKGISTKLRYFQISSVALNFRLIEKEKKGKKNHFWI